MKSKSTIWHEHHNSYVINIHMRGKSDSNFLVGTIRSYGESELKIFNTVDELLSHITEISVPVDEKKSAKRGKSGAGENAGIKEDTRNRR